MPSVISASTTSGTALSLTADTSGVLEIKTGVTPTTAMTIDGSQNVGIGTSSPSYKLQVSATQATVGITSTTASQTPYLILNNTADSSNSYIFCPDKQLGIVQSDTSANSIVYFSTQNTERMRIDSSGNLLVGTTTTVSSARSAFYSTTTVPAAEFRVNAGSSDATQAVGIIKNSTTNTTAQVLMNFAINNGNTGAGQINCNGASAAAFGTFSDSRLKQNIVDLQPQLANIIALRPVEFDYIESEGGGHQIGFIAQEFEQVYSDAVGERTDGMKTLTGWSKTEARLVKAIQELKAELDATKAEVQALKGVA